MKHLSANEIIEFVSLTELNDEAKNLCATVNGHICKCKKCFELVKAFQMVKDELNSEIEKDIKIVRQLDEQEVSL